MLQMQNEITKLRRGDDLSSINPPPPQGVGSPNMGFRSITKELNGMNFILPLIELLDHMPRML
jgi:hypothetical protein